MAKLKVFRTPIGFHDAYVAAPSRKAALAAWGSDADLFARGVAEQVEDPKLTGEPLANPGKVIRLSRGSAAEQIAALPKDRPKRRLTAGPPEMVPSPAKPKVKPRKAAPKPDRRALDGAERALAEAERRHKTENDALADQLAELQRRRRTLETAQIEERTELERDVKQARTKYEKALRRWEG